jgi:hypothetical protein
MIDQNLIKKILREATSDGGSSRGSYVGPLQPGIRLFKKNEMSPFTIPVSKYDSPLLQYDSYDGKMDETKKQIKKIETKARKNSVYLKNHPELTTSDEDGNIINQTPGKKLKFVPIKEWVEIKNNTVVEDLFEKKIIKESNTSVTAGEFNGPFSIGLKKWPKSTLAPFDYELDHYTTHHAKKSHLKNNKKSNTYYKGPEFFKKIKDESHPVHTINEDLAVWFGKKKKPKGSKQPKGPWVDICRKVDGKHPPCGRSDASKGSYPKCRAAGVAGKMSASQKRNACQQKRKAEKNDPQSGKGQKPVMTSYKTKKESVDSLVFNILSEIRNSF